MNQVCIVGRLAEQIQIKELENGKTVAEMILRVSRPFKNADGVYEEDKIRCTLFNGVASNANTYLKINNVVGIKGRLSCDDVKSGIKLIADKVTFLSSSAKSEA